MSVRASSGPTVAVGGTLSSRTPVLSAPPGQGRRRPGPRTRGRCTKSIPTDLLGSNSCHPHGAPAPENRAGRRDGATTLRRMADQSTQSIVIDAPAAEVMAVIADFPSYPTWVSAAKQVEVGETGAAGRARRVHFVLDAGAVKDDYVLDYTWAGARRVDWTLVQGQTQKKQDGSYVLAESGGATTVTYSITIDLSIPMLGLIKRKAEKVILDTALKELKKRVEA